MGEGEGGMIWENSIEAYVLSSVKQIASPGWMHETMLRAGALGWPRGMGWGGRWVESSGWGTFVNPWLIHANVWQEPLQYCKLISLQLIKINKKKKRPWCWERLKAGGEGYDRRWDGCMTSLTWWTWVWASSGSWWWTGKTGVLQSFGSEKVGHDLGTEQWQWKQNNAFP